MAWTESDRDTLDTAIARGIKTVSYSNGNTVTYHSLQEMLALRAAMTTEIAEAAAASSSTNTRVSRIAFYRD